MKSAILGMASMNYLMAMIPGNALAPLNVLVGCLCLGVWLGLAIWSTCEFVAECVDRK